MCLPRTYIAVLLSLVLTIPICAQQATTQTTSSSPQALALLQKSLAALTGGQPFTDVTLSGTARRIAGSGDESGTVTLKVLSSGATRLDINFPTGPRTEFKSFDAGGSIGSWSGSDGISHPIANHNLVNDWGWFPVFTHATSANTQTFTVLLVGAETRNGQSVLHLKSIQQFPALSGDDATLMQHLSETDVFLDATTLLPTSIAYNIHPDNNALLDIPVELYFSDYRPVNGAQIAFHIQKCMNNSLLLDLQFQNATLNTGMTAAQLGGAQ